MKYRKVPVQQLPLNYFPVYVESIYGGRVPFKVVGIKENQIEVEKSLFGFKTNKWVNINECFTIATVCEQQLQPNGCQAHNLFCCGGGNEITQHLEYWENLIN